MTAQQISQNKFRLRLMSRDLVGLTAAIWRIGYRYAASDPARMRRYAAELVSGASDVIFAFTPQVLETLKQHTNAIRIVFVNVADPVGAGLVQSLSRPGGNLTGFANYDFSIAGKWLELIKEADPGVAVVAVLMMPQHVTNAALFQAVATAGSSIRVRVTEAYVRNSQQVEQAIETIGREANGALVVLPSPITTDQHQLIVELAARYRLPAVYPYRDLAQGGGLMSYGPDILDDYRRAAIYVNRILRGENPSNLPIQAPTKYDLVVNLKTAKALGLTIPQSILLRTAEVIE